MVRQAIAEHYPDEVYTRGFRVYTTIPQGRPGSGLRRAAQGRAGLRPPQRLSRPGGLLDLPAERRRGRLRRRARATIRTTTTCSPRWCCRPTPSRSRPACATARRSSITGEGLRFAARALDAKTAPQKRIRRGSIIRVQREGKNWQITQLPEVEAAFVALDPQDGAIRALVGGFDFDRNKFNHVTQAWRQPGSRFKPFIYSAALEKGFTPATVINDAPLVLDAEETGSQRWEPKNYDGKFDGPMRLRTALAKSKNMVSIRILQAIGAEVRAGLHHALRLRCREASGLPDDGARRRLGDAVADGARLLGVRQRRLSRQPYFIHKIVDDRGNVLALAEPQRAGDEALRVIDARNAFIMDNLLQDVTRVGTARARRRAQAHRPRRQDRHDQRIRRRLVRRLSAVARRHRVDRLRPAEDARQERDGRRGRAADLVSATWRRC